MSNKYLVRRDTSAWIFQVWSAFALAVFACAGGIWQMPSQDLDRAFLVIGFFFCLFASFTLAKMIRDNRDERIDTGPWMMTVWVGFVVAVVLTAWGLFRMKIGDWEKAYMVVSWLFLVSAVFSLAKTVRDKHEADLLESSSDEPAPRPVPTSASAAPAPTDPAGSAGAPKPQQR